MPFDPTLLAFLAKKLVAALVLPPAGPLLLILLGLSIGRLRKLAWLGWFYAAVTTIPASVNALMLPLEAVPTVTRAQVATTGAIVILGGGVRSNAPELGGTTVNALTLERLRFGALVARGSGLPVLVAGGAPEGYVPEATLMRDVLENEYGVPVRWIESTSLDTRDNAVNSARLLKAAGIARITLVTHAAHMRRAQAAFEEAGLQVTPAPTAWQSNPDIDYLWRDFIPSARSAYSGWYAMHEWLGRLAYALSPPEPEISRHSERAIQPSTSTPATSEPQSNH